MSNLKLLALLLVVGNLDCMQQKQPTGKDSSLAGAIAAVAVTGLLYYRQNYKKQQLESAACGSSQYDPESQAGFCYRVYPYCPRVFKGLTYSRSSMPELCLLKIKNNFFELFIGQENRTFVIEDTYQDAKGSESKMIRLGERYESWAIGASIRSYKLIKKDKQESLLKLELVNSEQRADIMRENCNAVLPFIYKQDIDAELAQQEEQQSSRSFMGVIRNAASYVASWFKRS